MGLQALNLYGVISERDSRCKSHLKRVNLAYTLCKLFLNYQYYGQDLSDFSSGL